MCAFQVRMLREVLSLIDTRMSSIRIEMDTTAPSCRLKAPKRVREENLLLLAPTCPNTLFSASNTATLNACPTRSRCGKRNSVTSQTVLKL